MKYAIYGAGSLGIVLSAFLKQSNEEFDLRQYNEELVKKLGKNVLKNGD